MDDLPITVCDSLWIECAARDDLAGDGQCRHPDAVSRQISPNIVAAERSAALPSDTVPRTGIG